MPRLVLLVVCAWVAGAARVAHSQPSLFSLRYPKQYAAFHLHADEGAIVIDGLLNDTAWEHVAFSDAFVDIQGPRHWSQPWFSTRVKLRYDATTLYVGAYLEETAVWANESQRNAVVFHDNDFEVFVDADASTHNYKEIEVNARNASWNLWLNKPYRSGGHENSTRVDPEHGFDMFGKGFRCAVHTDGPINDPTTRLHYWTVEMALPLAELARYTRVETLPPRAGSFWRINFSRVEYQVRVVTDREGRPHYEKLPGIAESNWVWSPQYAVDMHRPEWWGYLQFRAPHERPTANTSVVIPRDPDWRLRYTAIQLFYAQEAYKQAHGRYALAMDTELGRLFPDPGAVVDLKSGDFHMNSNGSWYSANLTWPRTNTVSIQSDSLLAIHRRGFDRERLGDWLSVE